jgi:hypothetical protein
MAFQSARHIEHGQIAGAVARVYARLGRSVPAGTDGWAAPAYRRYHIGTKVDRGANFGSSCI